MFVIYCYPPDGDGAACRVVKDWGLLWLILTVDELGDEFIIAAEEVTCKLLVEIGNKLIRDSEEQIEQNKEINLQPNLRTLFIWLFPRDLHLNCL